MHIISDYAESCCSADRNTQTVIFDPAQVYAAGHLYIAVIGADADVCSVRIGYSVLGLFIRRAAVPQQGVYVAAVFIQSQAERHCTIRCRTFAVIGNGQPQGCGCFSPILYSHIFHSPGLGNIRRENPGVYVTVQQIEGHGCPQSAFQCAIVGRRAFSAGKPVQGRRSGPGAGEQIVTGCIVQGSGSLRVRLLAQI